MIGYRLVEMPMIPGRLIGSERAVRGRRAIARPGHLERRAKRSSNSLRTQSILDGTSRAAMNAGAAQGPFLHPAEMARTRMNTAREASLALPRRAAMCITKTRCTRMDTGDERGRRFAKRPLRAPFTIARDPHGYWLKSNFGVRKTHNLMDCFFRERTEEVLEKKGVTKNSLKNEPKKPGNDQIYPRRNTRDSGPSARHGQAGQGCARFYLPGDRSIIAACASHLPLLTSKERQPS